MLIPATCSTCHAPSESPGHVTDGALVYCFNGPRMRAREVSLCPRCQHRTDFEVAVPSEGGRRCSAYGCDCFTPTGAHYCVRCGLVVVATPREECADCRADVDAMVRHTRRAQRWA